MTPLGWVFLGTVALVATVQALRTADDQLAIIAGLAGAIAWLLWAFFALNLTVYSGGTAFTEQYPSLAVFGLVMAAPNIFVAVTGPLFVAAEKADYVPGARR